MSEPEPRGTSASRWLYPFVYRLRKRWQEVEHLAEPSTRRVDGLWHDVVSFSSILSVLPLRLPESVEFVIEGAGRPTTKSAIMRDALVAAGVDSKAIWLLRQPKAQEAVRRLLRVVLRLPRAVCVFLNVRRKRSLDRRIQLSIVALDAFTRWLRRHSHVRVLVNSDVGPAQALLAVGAARAGNDSVWWQDDYHHATVPSLGFTHGVVLNEAGRVGFEKQCARGLVYGRQEAPSHIGVRSISDDVKVMGVVVNNLFRGTTDELERIRDAMMCFGAEVAHLRLHPNSRVSIASLAVSWLVIAPRSESLEVFAGRLPVVLTGNTAAQLRVLAGGTPVVHVAGLDRLGYDTYGYVARSIVFGEPRLQPSPVQRVNAFYGCPAHQRRLEGAVEQTPLPALVEFARQGLGSTRMRPQAGNASVSRQHRSL